MAENRGSNISRRKFLQGGAALVAVSVLKSDAREHRERLQAVPDNIVIVDFAPERLPSNTLITEVYPDRRSFVKEVVGNDYISRLSILGEYGPEVIETGSGANKAFINEHALQAAVEGSLMELSDHGKNISESVGITLAHYGKTSDVHMIPLQNILLNDKDSVYEVGIDEIGNLTVSLDLRAEPVIEKLEAMSDQDVVNLSLQFGKVSVIWGEFERIDTDSERRTEFFSEYSAYHDEEGNYHYFESQKNEKGVRVVGYDVQLHENGERWNHFYDTPVKMISQDEYDVAVSQMIDDTTEIVPAQNPDFRVIEAYGRAGIENSLREMFKVCDAFPDRVIVAAAGNMSADFTNARELLADEWPQNSILVGEWDTDSERSTSRGIHNADIYVDNKKFTGKGDVASYATPIISAHISLLINQGYSAIEAKKILLENAREFHYTAYASNKKRTARVLEPGSLDSLMA